MGSRPSAPSTEVIQKPQRPIITGTTFSRNYLMGQAMLANKLQEAANTALGSYAANANIGRAPGEEYTPLSIGTFDYETLIPAEEDLAKQYDKRREEEKEKRQKEQKDDKSEREKYADTLAVTQMRPAGGAARMTGGG